MAERNLYPSEKQDRLIVRFPDGMRDQIARLAKANNRSMNAEVLSYVERCLASNGSAPNAVVPPENAELLEEMRRQRAEMNKVADLAAETAAIGFNLAEENKVKIEALENEVRKLSALVSGAQSTSKRNL
jgi:lipase chaperone LimK